MAQAVIPSQLVPAAEPITHFFVALFIASIGLILSPVFLLHHLSVLAAGVSVVVIGKTALVSSLPFACGMHCVCFWRHVRFVAQSNRLAGTVPGCAPVNIGLVWD